MLVFEQRGKPEGKTSRSREENQQQTQPTYDVESGNRTRATLVEGECSHHCAIAAPSKIGLCTTLYKLVRNFVCYTKGNTLKGFTSLLNTSREGRDCQPLRSYHFHNYFYGVSHKFFNLVSCFTSTPINCKNLF